MSRSLNFAAAINEAMMVAMEADENVISLGLGMDDPKRIFGTTSGLIEKFGSERVFDMPTSENGMTGVAVGASLNGIRPVMTHQRLDFFLLAMDQLVNSAAKWHYMFGGANSAKITIRLILGRGWGQGPTHSQNLMSWFAHIPGLKVVVPTTAKDAKGLLLSSIFDDNPVVFLEHRWLHNLESEVPEGDYRLPLGEASVLEEGDQLTIVSMSYMTVEAMHAMKELKKQGVSCDIIDLRSANPIDWETIFASVEKTGRLLVLDTASRTCSVSSEIVARVASEKYDCLKAAPKSLALVDHPSPSTPALSQHYYHNTEDVIRSISDILELNLSEQECQVERNIPHDIPGDWFKGPF